jgi:hypothetical protein
MNVMIVGMNGVKVMVKESNDIDWAYQNALREQWLKNNPDAGYIGWMSI